MNGWKKLRPLLVAFVLAWAVSSLAHAAWSPDPNQNNPIAVVADEQSFPLVIGDNQLGGVVAWRSARFDPGTGTTVYDIDAQRFDPDGVPQWGPTGVRVVSGSVSPTGTLALTNSGGAIVAWHDIRNSPDAGDIYAQKLNSVGIPQWTVGGVPVTTAFGLQERPALLPDQNGGAVFIWQDHRAGPTNSDIYAQRLDASGLPQWVATDVPVCSAPGDQALPAIAVDSNGATVTWVDSRSGDQDIYAQVLSLAGGPQWTLDGVPVAALPGAQTRPRIASGGAPVIVWEDDRNGGDKDVYAQWLNPLTGGPIWTTNGVQVANTPNASAPIAAGDASGLGVVIVWQDDRNGAANVDIFAQRLNSLGTPQWPLNGVAVSGAPGSQVSPVGVVMSESSQVFLIVAWEDARNGTADIFAQRIDLSGAVAWTPDGVPISTAPNRQGHISMLPVSSFIAGVILVWDDDRNTATGTDIYAAKVGLNGVLPVSLQSLSVE